jgi:hypothetical protein
MTKGTIERPPLSEGPNPKSQASPRSLEEADQLRDKLLPVFVPILLSIAAAFSYGLLRSGYVRFYSPLWYPCRDATILCRIAVPS